MNQIKEPLKQPKTVFHNGRVAVGEDLVFTWVVLTVPHDSDQAQWQPADQLTLSELRDVQRRIDGSAIFPQAFRDWLAQTIAAANLAAAAVPPLEQLGAKPTLH